MPTPEFCKNRHLSAEQLLYLPGTHWMQSVPQENMHLAKSLLHVPYLWARDSGLGKQRSSIPEPATTAHVCSKGTCIAASPFPRRARLQPHSLPLPPEVKSMPSNNMTKHTNPPPSADMFVGECWVHCARNPVRDWSYKKTPQHRIIQSFLLHFVVFCWKQLILSQ